MDQQGLATVSRYLHRLPSRRDILGGLAGIGFGLGTLQLEVTRAKHNHHKNHKNHKKRSKQKPALPPPPFNAFGCLDVGQPCQGDSTLCCSGVCDSGHLNLRCPQRRHLFSGDRRLLGGCAGPVPPQQSPLRLPPHHRQCRLLWGLHGRGRSRPTLSVLQDGRGLPGGVWTRSGVHRPRSHLHSHLCHHRHHRLCAPLRLSTKGHMIWSRSHSQLATFATS
jgi:hypothetical protein